MSVAYRPHVFNMLHPNDRAELASLRGKNPALIINDRIHDQLIDLVHVEFPGKKLTERQTEEEIAKILNGVSEDEFGCWIHYPWANRLVHLLDEELFQKVRTNRNKNKISKEEQAVLGNKKIGIIGLSVGHAVAMTLALERSFGELVIADHDVLDLSNLNRIRSTVSNIGIQKTVLAAREIAELDPYLHITCIHEGITDENMDDFLNGLDLVIDECDSLDVKLKVRSKAKEKGIPVIMETSDRGMLDIERFDLDPSYPLLHGLASGLDIDQLANLSNPEKIPHILKIIGFNDSSEKLRSSMMEIGKTLRTWPQLGSDVMHGGGSVANAARRVLLGEPIDSGRYYIDFEEQIPKRELIKN